LRLIFIFFSFAPPLQIIIFQFDPPKSYILAPSLKVNTFRVLDYLLMKRIRLVDSCTIDIQLNGMAVKISN